MDVLSPRSSHAAETSTMNTPRAEPLDLDASYWLDVVGEDSGETLCTSLVSEGCDDEIGGGSDDILATVRQKTTTIDDTKSGSAQELQTQRFTSPPRPQQQQQQGQQQKQSPKPPTRTLHTPQTKWSMRSDSRTKLNNHFLSPFSTKLRRQLKQNGDDTPDLFYMPPNFSETDLSLSPCRKVSVVVHIPGSASFQQQRVSEQAPRLCIFPLVDEDTQQATNSGRYQLNHQQSSDSSFTRPTLSPTSATLRSSTSSKDVVIVNPSAFGKYIPSEVTMETARLVAQVANIPSEDWARTYRFQHVLWPDNYTRSLWHLALAVANDALPTSSRQQTQSTSQQSRPQGGSPSCMMYNNHRLLVATGSADEKRRTMFGSSATREDWVTDNGDDKIDSTMDNNDKDQRQVILQRYGVLGATLSSLLKRLPEYAVCALSMYEICDEDVIIDRLAPPKQNQVQLRHAKDGKGAIVHGLSEVPVDSLSSLAGCLQQALSGRTKKDKNTTKGHLMVSLKIWQSAVQHDLQTRCAVISFLDLALGAPQNSASGLERSDRRSPHRQQQPKQSMQESRKVSFLRKSVSTLGGVLRGTLLREAGSDTVIPYRDSTLTKVLQRSLSSLDCRVVVLASVSPLSDAYDATMDTLRYVERLLVRPGTVPRSPFDRNLVRSSPQSSPESDKSQSSSPQLLVERFAGKESLVESLVTDPRQRLAKFYKSPAMKESPPSDAEGFSFGGVTGTGYMQVDPATVHQEVEKPDGSDGQGRSSFLRADHTEQLSGTVVRPHSPENAPFTPKRAYSTPLSKYLLPSPIDKQEEEDGQILPCRDTFDSIDTFSGLPLSSSGNVAATITKECRDEQSKVLSWQRNEEGAPMYSESALEEQTKRLKVQLKDKETEISALWSTVNNGISEQAKLKEQSQSLLDQLDDKEREISSLIAKLEADNTDRADVEKIAEEAISAQDSLEQKVRDLELRLSKSRQKCQTAKSEIGDLSQTKDSLSQELHRLRDQHRSLQLEHDDRQVVVIELELQSKNLESERQQLLRGQAESAATIVRLNNELVQVRESSQRETERLGEEINNLEHERQEKAEAQRRREADLLEKLAQSNESLRGTKISLSKAKEQLASLEQRDRVKSSALEQELSSLRQELSELNNEVAVTEGHKNVAVEERNQERARNEAISTELERTRVILGLRLSDVAELSSSLEQALEESQELKDEIARNRDALESFQTETKQRVQRVVHYRDEAANLLDSTMAENRTLAESNQQLQMALSRIRDERDNLLHDLEQSRKLKTETQHGEKIQLSRVQVELAKTRADRDDLRSQLVCLRQEYDDLFSRRQDRGSHRDSRRKMEDALEMLHPGTFEGRDWEHDTSKPPASTTHGRLCPNCSPAPSKLENWNERRASSRDLSIRAEEIAALLALSARKSVAGRPTSAAAPSTSVFFKSHHNGRNIYSQGGTEKEVLISILERKVDRLEKALVFGEDSSASVEGSQPI